MTPKERWPAVLDREKFSFRYGGRSSDEFLVKWQQTRSVETTPGGKIEHIAYAEAGGGLNVLAHVRRLDDFPAVDWVVEFENQGPEPTPILEDILALDAAVAIPAAERVRLHHAKGSSCRIDDFLPQTDSIAPGGDMLLAPAGGRSSNGVLPFMNIQRDGGGMVLAVGWSGQWMARLNRDEKALHLSAGMERVQLTLHPGEKIRTPRVLILHWEGDDEEQGNNLLRRLLIAHYLPRIDGRLVMPPLAQCLQGYFYASGQANEQLELTALPKVAALGADTYWIDACWYGKGREWWQEVGTWTVNPDRFPRGLKPISNAAHEAGMKFILWFEPERVQRETAIEREHPEFLLRCEDNPDNALLNLGMPEARAYITDAISDIISESGVDIYRQDFNFDPLPYWQAADAPDRIGMTEIRHVEGLYELWDELRRRHPGLWIDNCSSGGRRIDLETLSRSLPLWPSDFPDICGLPYGRGMQVGDQCINAGLSRWIPLFGGGVWNFTPYVTRGQIVGGFTFGMHIPVEDFPPDDDPENSDQQAIAAK
ncbi:MAG: alpha-galactosidase, partial [Planctomycetes bacterium]|nr:alpha-galactosidase [Planctomycetota bacterium]